MVEKQVTGTRLAGRVEGWMFHNDRFIYAQDDAVVALVLENGDRMRIPMDGHDAQKVLRGDIATVTVEITREPGGYDGG